MWSQNFLLIYYDFDWSRLVEYYASRGFSKVGGSYGFIRSFSSRFRMTIKWAFEPYDWLKQREIVRKITSQAKPWRKFLKLGKPKSLIVVLEISYPNGSTTKCWCCLFQRLLQVYPHWVVLPLRYEISKKIRSKMADLTSYRVIIKLSGHYL